VENSSNCCISHFTALEEDGNGYVAACSPASPRQCLHYRVAVSPPTSGIVNGSYVYCNCSGTSSVSGSTASVRVTGSAEEVDREPTGAVTPVVNDVCCGTPSLVGGAPNIVGLSGSGSHLVGVMRGQPRVPPRESGWNGIPCCSQSVSHTYLHIKLTQCQENTNLHHWGAVPGCVTGILVSCNGRNMPAICPHVVTCQLSQCHELASFYTQAERG
jgi:hypothetical protein